MKTVWELEEIAGAKGKDYVRACSAFQAGEISKEECQKIRDDWQEAIREYLRKSYETLPVGCECCRQFLADESD